MANIHKYAKMGRSYNNEMLNTEYFERDNAGFTDTFPTDDSNIKSCNEQETLDGTVIEESKEDTDIAFNTELPQETRARLSKLGRKISEEAKETYQGWKEFLGYSCQQKIVVLLPVLQATIPPFFIVISLIVASIHDNLFANPEDNLVPYISDVGNFKPQSSVFTFGLSISSLCTFGTIVIRYCQGKAAFDQNTLQINLAAYWIGCILVLGKFIVSSFQLSSNKAIHYTGAALYVGGSMTYCTLQAYLSYRNKEIHWKKVIYARFCLVLFMISGGLIFGLFQVPSLKQYNRGGASVAQIAEWIFAGAKMAFFLSFVSDFRRVRSRFEVSALIMHPNAVSACKSTQGNELV